MKIFPIKLERESENHSKIVEWQLGNTCNYDCHFCPSHIKNGSLKWLDIDLVKKVCKSLIDTSDTKISFIFTGGEPTLYRDINEILKFISDSGHTTVLHSNGSRSLRYWKELADSNTLNVLPLSLHLHQGADIEHFKKIISLFSETTTIVTVYIMCDINFFDKCVNALAELKQLDVLLSMRGINVNGKLDNYSPAQLDILRKNSLIVGSKFSKMSILQKGSKNKVRLSLNDGSHKIMRNSDIQVSPEINNFYGWECDIGKDLLDIKYDAVYRGMCQVGGPIANINDDIKWKTDSVICNKNQCSCATDILQPKRMIL